MPQRNRTAYIFHLLRAARYRVTGVVGRAILRGLGVRYGAGLVLKGLPLVKCAPGSSITIGREVMMISYPPDTALGVNHAVVLETLTAGAWIRIGDRVGISGGSFCAQQGIEIGSDCLLGANVTIADTDFHPLLSGRRRYQSAGVGAAPVVLGRNVFVGSNVMILKGVQVGDNSVIGAGSIVTKSVPANAIAAGNPCRVIRLFNDEEMRLIATDR